MKIESSFITDRETVIHAPRSLLVEQIPKHSLNVHYFRGTRPLMRTKCDAYLRAFITGQQNIEFTTSDIGF